MTITRLLPVLILSFSCISGYAQQDHSELRETFARYFELLEKRDNAAAFDHIYPKLFALYPRPLLEAATDQSDDDTSTVITMDSSEILRVADILELDGVQYTRIDYSFRMHIRIFEEDDVDEDDEEDFKLSGTLAELMYNILKGQYGDKHTVFDPEKSRIDILVKNQLYAINDPAYDGWKFLEKKEKMEEVLAKLLPAKVLKKL